VLGVYSMLGRGARAPLLETTGNFVRACVVILLPVAVLAAARAHHHTRRDAGDRVGRAGIGCRLQPLVRRAAVTDRRPCRGCAINRADRHALAATWMLGESVTSRLAIAALLVASGVGLTIRRPT
jgi:drug/metabolite transporter (DMT)-like permease